MYKLIVLLLLFGLCGSVMATDIPTHKNVNGKQVELTDQEKTRIANGWARNKKESDLRLKEKKDKEASKLAVKEKLIDDIQSAILDSKLKDILIKLANQL